MRPELIFACVAIIVVGVAVIMYTLLRTPKTPAKIGDTPSIDLGEETPNEAAAETEAETTEETENEEVKSEDGTSI